MDIRLIIRIQIRDILPAGTEGRLLQGKKGVNAIGQVTGPYDHRVKAQLGLFPVAAVFLIQQQRGKRKRTMKIGFDNDKYLSMQSEHIREPK